MRTGAIAAGGAAAITAIGLGLVTAPDSTGSSTEVTCDLEPESATLNIVIPAGQPFDRLAVGRSEKPETPTRIMLSASRESNLPWQPYVYAPVVCTHSGSGETFEPTVENIDAIRIEGGRVVDLSQDALAPGRTSEGSPDQSEIEVSQVTDAPFGALGFGLSDGRTRMHLGAIGGAAAIDSNPNADGTGTDVDVTFDPDLELETYFVDATAPIVIDGSGAAPPFESRFPASLSVIAGSGDDTIFAGERRSSIDGGGGDDTIVGSDQGDSIEGWSGDDLLAGGPGDDEFFSLNGGDAVFGGPGVDFAEPSGDRGPLRFDLDDAEPEILGGRRTSLAGLEMIEGTKRADVMRGDDGANYFWGFGGSDRLVGRGGQDELGGDGGDDKLVGGGAEDQLLGFYGDDRLTGGNGSDSIVGDADGDLLRGNGGRDTFRAGRGIDRIAARDGLRDRELDCGAPVRDRERVARDRKDPRPTRCGPLTSE